jgi:acetoin utilization protein AcuB
MLVKHYMTRHPIMIGPEKPVYEAQKIMTENAVRHLPVVGDGKRLVGLVTPSRLDVSPERLGSLEVWEITRYLAKLTVKQVMIKGKDLHSIESNATLEEAADIMIRHQVEGLPVIEDGVVAGIITQTDLLVELQELLGAQEPGWRVVMRVSGKRGESSKISNVLSEKGWGIMAWGSVRTRKKPDHWDIIFKVRDCEEDELRSILESIEGQELIDIRETLSAN